MIAFDLLLRCELLREHVAKGKVVLGVNRTLCDFETQRTKDLDLVIAQPGSAVSGGTPVRTFEQLAEHYGVVLEAEERAMLESLPTAVTGSVGSVLVALEAKACMTAHVRALPRLHDELDSSHQTVHGNSKRALAVGFVMVNAADTFVSPDKNKLHLHSHPPVISAHRQPADAIRVIDKVKEIRRRSGGSSTGFDALGIMVVELVNDGSPIGLRDHPTTGFPYDSVVRRVAHEYSAAFARL